MIKFGSTCWVLKHRTSCKKYLFFSSTHDIWKSIRIISDSIFVIVFSSVSDPGHFYTDPDPDPTQNKNTDPDPIRILLII